MLLHRRNRKFKKNQEHCNKYDIDDLEREKILEAAGAVAAIVAKEIEDANDNIEIAQETAEVYSTRQGCQGRRIGRRRRRYARRP